MQNYFTFIHNITFYSEHFTCYYFGGEEERYFTYINYFS